MHNPAANSHIDDLAITSGQRVDRGGRRRLNGATHAGPGVTLTILIPTRNEIDGVGALLTRLDECAPERSEVLFVDDSDDATSFRIRKLTESEDLRVPVRLIHRPVGLRSGGLGGAVVAGMRAARGTYVLVMDADLQHPPELIGSMLAKAVEEKLDLVVGSRYAEGGTDSGLSGPARRAVSRTCAAATRSLFPSQVRRVSDPLSGFFLLRKSAINLNVLRPRGFKILLEILSRNPGLRVGQVGFTFGERHAGQSKASVREGVRLAMKMAALRAPTRPAPVDTRVYYDVHGLVSVESDRQLPELEKFRTRKLDGPPTIRVAVSTFEPRRSGDVVIGLDAASAKIRYAESMGRASFVVEAEDTGATTEVRVSPAVAASPHVLYTNVVEPILRWRLVDTGHAFVHAACFTDGERAFLITARTDTGKTTTMLKLLAQGKYSFVSDDLVIVDAEGKVLTYPKPLTISNHTVHALKSAELTRTESFFLPAQSRLHSRNGRRFAFLLTRSKLPVASINGVVQRLVPPPKYHVERLVPGVPSKLSGRLTEMVVIERGEDGIEALSHAEALKILLANCEDAFGFPPYTHLERLLLSIHDDDLRGRERAIISSALKGAPAHLVRSSSMGWAEVIPDLLAAPTIGAPTMNGRATKPATQVLA